MRDLNRLTLEEFTGDLDFWESLPSIVEHLLRRHVELSVDGVEDLWTFFEEFLLDYSRIVLHLVRLDTRVLSRYTGEAGIDPPLSTSQRYLQTFSLVFNSPNAPFYVMLRRRYRDDTFGLLARLKAWVTSSALDAPGALMQYASHVLALLPKCPSIFAIFPMIMYNSLILFECDFELKHNGPAVTVIDLTRGETSLQSFYETTRAVDKGYRKLISKKSQVVTSEMSAQLITTLFRIYQFLCIADPDFMLQLAKELEMTIPDDTNAEQTQMCVVWTWKFNALKKQILEGRMELRVNGVETIQSDLVNIWSNHASHQPSTPFVQYMMNLLRESKFLEYLMSVDSHPQLIGRASNIFGFLIVGGNYDNYITDIIWKAVTDSQDDRTVAEVVAMLARTFSMHTSRSGALSYVCSKLLELPLERFDAHIIDLCQQLVPRMQERPFDRDYRITADEDHVDPISLKLCVRLIRESAGTDLPIEKKKPLQDLGSQQLVQLIKAGLTESDKIETYESCVQDIAEMNTFTAGSIQVLNGLVSFDTSRELWKLATEFDLTRLVITELHHFVDRSPAVPSDLSSQHGFGSRVELLRRIIDLAPETITPELGNTLWKEILMSDKLTCEERKIVWKMVQDTTLTTKANPFVERCIHEYLPGVLPQYYSPEVLCFAQQSVFYEIRLRAPPIVGEDEIISVPGIDRIWNFILTAPPHTIEADAIKFAIDLYLDHGIISRSPRSAIDATHVALVDRCVDQLKSAAAALKPSCNGNVQGDDAMEVDNRNETPGTEELMFSRSLSFLRKLLHGLRTRPRYITPQSTNSSLPSFSDRPLKGNAVTIRYQCFGVPSSLEIRAMTIGELSTATDLLDMVTRLSRFSKFSLISGGQKLNLLHNPNALVKDLNMTSGLLIVTKAPNAELLTFTDSSRSMTAVDNEVLKHFDELYDLLSLKGGLARQVRADPTLPRLNTDRTFCRSLNSWLCSHPKRRLWNLSNPLAHQKKNCSHWKHLLRHCTRLTR